MTYESMDDGQFKDPYCLVSIGDYLWCNRNFRVE